MEPESKPVENGIELLSKEDAKVVMKQKDFENFINKTSRIMERALNQDFDITGAFFETDDSDQTKASSMIKGDKITQMFTFQDDIPLKRAITSIEWSPKVIINMLMSID